MKLLKFIIFLSILVKIFLIIYRNSNNNKKGLKKFWRSFRIAIVIAASLASLNSESLEATEPSVSNSQLVHERLVSNQKFNSLEENDRKVILVKNSNTPPIPGSRPNNFRARPTPPSRAVYVNPYRTAPKLVNQRFAAAKLQDARRNPAGANGGGGGGGVDGGGDDNCPVPKKEQSQKSKTSDYDSIDYTFNSKKKNKSGEEECELDENVKIKKIEIVDRIKEDPSLVREAKRMGKDQKAKKDVNHLIEQLSLGNKNPGIRNRRIKTLKNVSEARAKNGGRVYFRERNGKIEILGKSNKANQEKVINILQKLGY